MKAPALAIAALIVTCACAQQPAMNAKPAASSPAACNAEAVADAVGKPMDAALQEQLRVRAQAQRVRVVRPGQMVTMDFDEARLTIDLDARGRITRVRCG